MKKNTASDELDLLELILTLWKGKWKIIFAVALAIIITFSLHVEKKPAKLIYSTNSKIQPISTFDEFEYEAYNSYLKSVDSKSILHQSISEVDTYDAFGQKRREIIRSENEIYKIIDNSSFKKIDKYYLLNLFLDKLNEKYLIISAIKKLNLINKVNYENNEAYENAVTKYASKIKITQKNVNEEDNKRGDDWNIVFKTDDQDTWEKVLFFIEKSTNNEIRKYLFNSFNQLILNEQRLKQYKIEDIEWDISNNLDNIELVTDLKNRKQKITENKDIERLVNLFNKTPIATGDNFISAKIRIESTNYKLINKKMKSRSLTLKLFMAGIFGAVLAIIYVLISTALRNRNG